MTTPCFLVALDEGPEADRVLTCAITLAVPSQAHLVLFHVRDNATMNPWSYTGQATRNARQTMQASLTPVQAAGLFGEAVLAHGTPWKEICAAAAEYKVALIVLGRGSVQALRPSWGV